MLHQAISTSNESEELIDMILAGLLVQTVSLFRETVDQRPAASHFHGMLVTASHHTLSTQNDTLNFCPLDDQAMWSHQLMLELGTSEYFCGGSIAGRCSVEGLDSPRVDEKVSPISSLALTTYPDRRV
jgi:hypothetical protein